MSAHRIRPPPDYSGAALSAVCRPAGNPSWPAGGCLPHVDLGTTALKRNLVHYGLHQPDATPVIGPDVFGSRGIGYRIRVKSLSLVLDDDGNSLSQFTAATNLN